jgi:small subunit ribosomal protein S16
MLKIRLTRTGKKNSPSYRIVVANRRSKRDGESLAILGFYNPRTTPRTIEYNKDEAKKWMAEGAIPTDTVRYLFEKTGLLPKLKGAKTKFSDKKGKKATERAAKEKAPEAK